MGMKSELIPINERSFIVRDNTQLGEGNFRIEFIDDTSAILRINLGIMISDVLPIKKISQP